jgi:hypothetical protein
MWVLGNPILRLPRCETPYDLPGMNTTLFRVRLLLTAAASKRPAIIQLLHNRRVAS